LGDHREENFCEEERYAVACDWGDAWPSGLLQIRKKKVRKGRGNKVFGSTKFSAYNLPGNQCVGYQNGNYHDGTRCLTGFIVRGGKRSNTDEKVFEEQSQMENWDNRAVYIREAE